MTATEMSSQNRLICSVIAPIDPIVSTAVYSFCISPRSIRLKRSSSDCASLCS